MFAALAAAPAAPDSGLTAAVIVAAGVTALVALGMTMFTLHRSARLTVLRALGTAGLGLLVVAAAAIGVLTVSPASAQAAPGDTAPAVSTTVDDDLDLQLPTL
jgi:multisubunit Na+/H+ antiporter MnhB subunit